MSPRIAIVGGGPTAVYMLKTLTTSATPLTIHIFERESVAGPGMPYREGMNEPQMLSNIASREIPAVGQSLFEWLDGLDNDGLKALDLTRDDVSEDAFYPRLVLGAYYTAQLGELVARGRALGHRIELLTRARVTDIDPQPDEVAVRWHTPAGRAEAAYDHVAIATGHDWPDQTRKDGVTFVTPWPAAKLRKLRNRSVGVLGSSLSAIDVAVVLAQAHGRFVSDDSGLIWQDKGNADGFSITMMSRNGLLPEADYYYPLPFTSLPSFHDDQIEAEVARGPDRLLDRAFELFAADLAVSDPGYADRIGLAGSTVESFAALHFAERLGADPFDWAVTNLAEARRDRKRRHAVPWRYALIRAHEVFEGLIPYLSEPELDRFHRYLKPVFTDCYASVPHRSIERMLALHKAGRLRLIPIGHKAEFAKAGDQVQVTHENGVEDFDTIVDARGQRAMKLGELGFPSLARRGVVGPLRKPEDFVLPLQVPCAGTIQCLALPVLLRRRPFVQGLPNACHMGEEAAAEILTRIGDDPARARGRIELPDSLVA